MATQYTAGLTTGQVLTAATMNSIGAAWETWTPNIYPSVGSFTTVTTNRARYGRIQNLVFGQIDFTVTTIGTAAGIPFITAPTTMATYAAGGALGSYRETAVVGLIGVISMSNTANTFWMQRYDNANVIGAGYRYVGTFLYEAA